MEKPPTTSKVVAYIVFGFIFSGFCILLFFIISKETISIADIPKGLEEYVFIQRFLSSQDCFAYQDKETLRIYPGIIDLEKFKQEKLEDKEDNLCYKFKKDVPEFRLKINDKIIQTSDNFDSIKKKNTIKKSILIFKEGKFENAGLEIQYETK